MYDQLLEPHQEKNNSAKKRLLEEATGRLTRGLFFTILGAVIDGEHPDDCNQGAQWMKGYGISELAELLPILFRACKLCCDCGDERALWKALTIDGTAGVVSIAIGNIVAAGPDHCSSAANRWYGAGTMRLFQAAGLVISSGWDRYWRPKAPQGGDQAAIEGAGVRVGEEEEGQARGFNH